MNSTVTDDITAAKVFRSDGDPRQPHNRGHAGRNVFAERFTLAALAVAPLVPWAPKPSLGPVKELLDADHKAGVPALLRDGRWLAYHSQEDGASKVYVRSYSGLGARVQVSKGWGEQPCYSRSRNELFYQGADRRVMVVPYSVSEGSFVPESADPRMLFASSSKPQLLRPNLTTCETRVRVPGSIQVSGPNSRGS